MKITLVLYTRLRNDLVISSLIIATLLFLVISMITILLHYCASCLKHADNIDRNKEEFELVCAHENAELIMILQIHRYCFYENTITLTDCYWWLFVNLLRFFRWIKCCSSAHWFHAPDYLIVFVWSIVLSCSVLPNINLLLILQSHAFHLILGVVVLSGNFPVNLLGESTETNQSSMQSLNI